MPMQIRPVVSVKTQQLKVLSSEESLSEVSLCRHHFSIYTIFDQSVSLGFFPLRTPVSFVRTHAGRGEFSDELLGPQRHMWVSCINMSCLQS